MPAIVLLLLGALRLCAQPAIGQNGVVNSASLIPPSLAGGAIARGALFTIRGVRLGVSTRSTTVTVAGVPVRVIDVQAERIDAQMPAAAPIGSDPLVIAVRGEASKAFTVDVASSNPGLFSRNERGWGPGRIDNLDAAGARSANSVANRATPGQRAMLAATGMGGLKEAVLMVGNRAAKAVVRISPRTGEEELAFQIPRDAPLGCFVPVYVQVTPVRASNVVTMAIGNEPCAPVPLLAEKKIGVAFFARTNMRGRHATADSIDDEATITFAGKNDQPVLSPLLLLPPPGTCTSYSSSFQADTVLPNSVSSALLAELTGRGVDAGPRVNLNRGNESRTIPRTRGAPGLYRMKIGHGGYPPSRRMLPLFLEPGEFTVAGVGGEDVGAFMFSATSPQPLEWINRDVLNVIDRNTPLRVRWHAAAGSLVVVLAANVDQITTATGTCLCTAHSADGGLSIPPAMLANLPASVDIPGVPYDQLYVALLPAKPAPAIPASGVDGGAVLSIYAAGRIVEYR